MKLIFPNPKLQWEKVGDDWQLLEIVERTLQRGRDLFSSLPNISYCKCGAPKAISKAGNPYCAARCWLK